MKAKALFVPLATLLIGYAAGAYLGFPQTSSGNAQGNIAKVDKFHRSVVGSQSSAFVEKIQNDTTELKKAVLSMTVLSSRMNEFSSLVDIAVKAASSEEALKSEVDNLKKLKTLSENAANAGHVALASLDNLINGSKNPEGIDYEQASQNLALAYLLVGRQIQVGKEYVSAVDNFLNNKKVENYVELAASRDLWARYCAGNAVLNQDKKEIAYWNNEKSSLSTEDLALALKEYDSQFKAYVALDESVIFKTSALSGYEPVVLGEVERNVLGEVEQNVLGEVERNVLGEVEQNVLGEVERNVLGEVEQNVLGEVEQHVLGGVEQNSLGLIRVDIIAAVDEKVLGNFNPLVLSGYDVSELTNNFESTVLNNVYESSVLGGNAQSAAD